MYKLHTSGREDMSIQSDAAKEHIKSLFMAAYPGSPQAWATEYEFAKLDMKRKWRFDYVDLACRCVIELDGATFKPGTGHNSGIGLRAWREKNNAAMAAGWRVWHYAPEEVIKAGRKTLPDDPILKELPWLSKREIQQPLTASPANTSGAPILFVSNHSSPGVAKGETIDHDHENSFYYCPICMQYQYPEGDTVGDIRRNGE